MADIKGKLNVTDIVVDNTGTINGKHIATSVNGVEANSTGMVDVSTIGTLQKNRDLNSVTKSEFHFFDQNSAGAPNIPELQEDSLGVGLTLDVPNLSTQLVVLPVGDDIKLSIRTNQSESKNPTSWSQWQFMASQKYVQDYVRDNGGSGSTSGYTKDEADAKFLPITSDKDAVVGKLTLKTEHEYPGIVYNVSSTGYKCGIEGSKGQGFMFWADDPSGTRTTAWKIPFNSSTGTITTQEWTKDLLHSRIIYNSGNTEILPMSLNKAGYHLQISPSDVLFKNGSSIRFTVLDNQSIFGTDLRIKPNYHGANGARLEINSPDSKQNILLRSYNDGVDVPTMSVLNGGVTNHIKLNVESGTLATREWTNQYVRSGSANTETILKARDGGDSFVFVRSSDMNIGMYLNGSTKFRIKETAITTESGCRTLAINGRSNSTSERPQLILDSVADLWRMEPDGAGKLQIVHPATGALYEFEKVGGTQQVASKQWVQSNYHSSLTINNISSSWISMRDQPCFKSGNVVSTASASAIVRQEHQDRHYILGGLGNTQFGIYMINKNQTTNGTNGRAYMDQSGVWICNDGTAATQQWVNAQGFSKGSATSVRFNNVRNITATGGSDHGSGSGAYSLTNFAESLHGYMVSYRAVYPSNTPWSEYMLYLPGSHPNYESPTTMIHRGGRGVRFEARIAY